MRLYNQTEHEFINRRNAIVKNYLAKLANLAPNAITTVNATPVSPVDIASTPFLRELQKRQLKFPQYLGKVVGEGEDAFTIDALYDEENIIVTYSSPSQQLSAYATEQGFDILEFPSEEAQYDAFFADNENLFKD